MFFLLCLIYLKHLVVYFDVINKKKIKHLINQNFKKYTKSNFLSFKGNNSFFRPHVR